MAFSFSSSLYLLPESAGEDEKERDWWRKKNRNRGDDRRGEGGSWVNLPAPPVARLSVCEVNERPTLLYCCLSPQLKLSGSDRLAASLISALSEIFPSPLNSNTLLICHKYILILMVRSSHHALLDHVELYRFVLQNVSRDASHYRH